MSGWRRFVMLLALGALAAGVFVSTAAALRFDDSTPCTDTQPVFVCPNGTVDAPYSIQFVGYGGCGPGLPYQYRVLNGALPPGLSLSSSGVLSGSPTNTGTWKFWVELSDQDPPTAWWCLVAKAQREFSITVNPRVLVTTESAVPGTVGAQYSVQLAAAMKTGPGATAPPSSELSWSVTQGQLPSGLALGASDGVISGTPTTEGSFSFTVRAALADGSSDTRGLTIVVRSAVAIAAPRAVPPSEVGVPLRLPLTASGGTGDGTYQWALTSGALPEGVALGPDGTVSGTPEVGGAFAFTATATDAEGRKADFAGRILVANRLSITTLRLRAGKVGRLYRAKLASTGGVVPKKWKVTKGPLPRGIRLDRTLGVLSGTPKKPGRYRVTFEARDALKVTSKKTLVIDVLA